MRSMHQEQMMTDQEILTFIRQAKKEIGLPVSKLAILADMNYETVKALVYGVKGARLHNVSKLLKALGYTLKVEKVGGRKKQVLIPGKVLALNGRKVPEVVYVVRPVNEFACLKCGRDAGVVSVAGHDQCAHCGHILKDCCGD